MRRNILRRCANPARTSCEQPLARRHVDRRRVAADELDERASRLWDSGRTRRGGPYRRSSPRRSTPPSPRARRRPRRPARRRGARRPPAAPSRDRTSPAALPRAARMTTGVATLYGRFATHAPRAGAEQGVVSRRPSRRRRRRATSASSATSRSRTGHELAIDLEREHVRTRARRNASVSDPIPAPISNDPVAGVDPGEAHDAARRVGIGEEVLAQRLREGRARARKQARTLAGVSRVDRPRHTSARWRWFARAISPSGCPRGGGDGRSDERTPAPARSASPVRHGSEVRRVGLDEQRSSGVIRAAARTSSAFLNVTMPLNERYAAAGRARRAPRRARR